MTVFLIFTDKFVHNQDKSNGNISLFLKSQTNLSRTNEDHSNITMNVLMYLIRHCNIIKQL